jgi:hypothetical protein
MQYPVLKYLNASICNLLFFTSFAAQIPPSLIEFYSPSPGCPVCPSYVVPPQAGRRVEKHGELHIYQMKREISRNEVKKRDSK